MSTTTTSRQRQADRRARRDTPHGTANGFVNFGCRCTPCRDANATYMRRYRAARRLAAGHVATVDDAVLLIEQARDRHRSPMARRALDNVLTDIARMSRRTPRDAT
jgi:hypothetical protein